MISSQVSSTTIVQFLSDLRRRDVAISFDGERLICNGPKDALTADLKVELAARKTEILEFLKSVRTGESALSHSAGRDLDRRELSLAQQRLWFLEQLEPGSTAYNIALAVLVSGSLDRSALNRALREILNRHEVMRSSFTSESGVAAARIEPADSFALRFEDLRGVPTSELNAKATADARMPFVIEKGPLFRATAYQISPTLHLLTLVLHHIISDGWSLGLLM